MEYSNTKINRFLLQDTAGIDQQAAEHDFVSIDSYLDGTKKYIHTDILITDASSPIELVFKSRLRMIMSQTLIRSLFLKEGIVRALNENNFPALYAVLKSFIETTGVLGYLAWLVQSPNSYENILEKMKSLALGNREAGALSVPTGVNSINVLTMLERADEIFDSLSTLDSEKGKNIFSTYYGRICNFGHPNWDSYLSIGILDYKTGIWKSKENFDGYKTELYGFYMFEFTASIRANCLFCSLIEKSLKVDSFKDVKSRQLFL